MAQKHPNILWIMTDQHNARCSGYAGHPVVKTPHLDGLAGHSIVFDQAFCNNPICAPSRISFATGLYPKEHGCFGNIHDPTEAREDYLASILRRNGYQTGLVGKSHTARSWDRDGYEKIWYTGCCDALPEDPLSNHYLKYLHDRGLEDLYEEGSENKPLDEAFDGSRSWPLPYEHSLEHYTGERALEFLRNRDEGRPFFLHLSFQRPHNPNTTSPEYFHTYDPRQIPLPENAQDARENFPGRPSWMVETHENRLARRDLSFLKNDPDGARLRTAMAAYISLVTSIDMEIGRVLEELKSNGTYEDTLIFYTSDHGDFAGEHGLMFKTFGMFDSIHRIPMLLKMPHAKTSRRHQGLVESIDWYPTVLQAAGLPVPAGRQGLNLAQTPGKDEVFCHHTDMAALVTAEWRLVWHMSHGTGELYHRATDPHEVRNLYLDPACSPVVKGLKIRLEEYLKDTRVLTSGATDRALSETYKNSPTSLMHRHGYLPSQVLGGKAVAPEPPTEEEIREVHRQLAARMPHGVPT